MKNLMLDRRRMLSGGMALGSTSLLSTKASGTEPTSITWLSLRPENWSRRDQSFTPTSGKLEIRPSSWLNGISCIAFAIGTNGAAWLEDLAASHWFSGLEPQPDDIAENGSAVNGQLLLEDEDLRNPTGISAMLKRIDWPTVPVAAIAVPHGAQSSDQTATLCLVSELRARRDRHGCRIAVVVTLESTQGDDAFELELLHRGAFVVRSRHGANGNHLHHFPLRASVYPRNGRLVCVDLADYLTCWQPGSSAELHVLPLASDYGHSAVDLLPKPDGITLALNIDMHWDSAADGSSLVELDRFATHCCEHFFRDKDYNYLFTTSDRLHGETGTVDIVVITRKAVEIA